VAPHLPTLKAEAEKEPTDRNKEKRQVVLKRKKEGDEGSAIFSRLHWTWSLIACDSVMSNHQ